MKPTFRTKSITSKVTEEEYARLEAMAAASGQSMSEWVREVLVGHQERSAAESHEEVLLAEVLGLRTILLNLLFKVAKGEPMTEQPFGSLDNRLCVLGRDRTAAKPDLLALRKVGDAHNTDAAANLAVVNDVYALDTVWAFVNPVDQAAVWDGPDVRVGDLQLVARTHRRSVRVLRGDFLNVHDRLAQLALFSPFSMVSMVFSTVCCW